MKFFSKGNGWWVVVRNIAVANVCGLLPLLWVGLGWMPDQVKVEMKGDGEPTIVADGTVLHGEEYGTWGEGTVWRFYIRKGMAWKGMIFLLPQGKGAEDVGRVELQKWKLLKRGKRGSGLARVEEGENGWRFTAPTFEWTRLASGKVSAGLAGVELLLLGISWVAAKRKQGGWKESLPSALCVAGAMALLFEVALPMQAYMANASEFPFGPGELAAAISVRAATAFVLCSIALGVLARCFGRLPLTLALAFSICAFLEAGILSAGLPSMNGNWDYFRNPVRALWDGAVWGGVFSAMLGLHPLLRRRLGWVALGVGIMVVASMFDVRSEKKVDDSRLLIHDFSSLGVVARSVEYSTGRNVLVFVIDSLECAQAHAVMEDVEAGSRLRKKFAGFTEYTNNIGTGDYSVVAVANLLTGKYPESAEGILDYYQSIFTSDSVLADALDKGYAVFLAEEKSYTNRRKIVPETERNTPVMHRPVKDGQGWTMDSIDRFRWMPFAAKLRCLSLMQLGMPTRAGLDREWGLYPVLGEAPAGAGGTGTFLFVHTEGVHVPVLRNRRGEVLPTEDNSDKGCVEMGVFIMEQLGVLLDAYREKGIYDDALILVLADHGHHESLGRFQETGDGELSGLARPFLWVKPAGSTGAFKTDGTPTSHSKVAGLLREALVRDLGEGEVLELMRCEHRLFRKVYAFDYMKEDWIVGPGGETEGHCTAFLDGVDEKGMQPVELGHRYSFFFENREDYAGILHSRHLLGWGRNLSWWPYQPDVELSFRVPDTNRHYSVLLEFGMWRRELESEEGLGIIFHQPGGVPVRWVRGAARSEEGEVSLRGLVPDETGVIRIVAEREPGLMAFVDFNYLQVNMEPH